MNLRSRVIKCFRLEQTNGIFIAWNLEATVRSQTRLSRRHVIYWLTAISRNQQMKKISTEEGSEKRVLMAGKQGLMNKMDLM